MAYEDRHLHSTADTVLDGATTIILFGPLNRIQVHKIAARVTNTAVGGATIDWKRRRGASTDTTIETVVIPASNQNGTLIYTEITNPTVDLEPGDLLIAVVTESGTAPTAVLETEYSIMDMKVAEAAGTEVVSA